MGLALLEGLKPMIESIKHTTINQSEGLFYSRSRFGQVFWELNQVQIY